MRLSIRKVDFFFSGLIVILLPFLFHLNFLITLNVSAADIFMVFLLFWLITQKENRDVLSVVLVEYHLIFVYMLMLIYFCILSMANYITNIFVDFPYGVAAILKLSVNFVYILVILVYLKKYQEELLLFLLRCWKIAGLIIALLCIGGSILYRFGIDNIFNPDGRAQATLNDPNLAALYLIVSLCMIILVSIYQNKKLTINFSMIMVFIALLLTASRGGMLSIALSLVIVLMISYLSGRIKDLLMFIVFGFLLSGIIFWVNHSTGILDFALERVTTIGSSGDGTSDRIFLWFSAFEMWTENPFIGVGIGQYIPYSLEMYGFTFSSIPHNTYLSFLAETGFLGFVAFIWFPLYLVLSLVSGLISHGYKVYFYLLIGLFAVAIQAVSINIENTRFIWVFLVITFVLIKHHNEAFIGNTASHQRLNWR